MGLMRFAVDQRSLLTEQRLARAFVAGPDETPYFGRVLPSGDQIVVERADDSSGCFSIPWPVRGQGEWLLATATLMERERPYLLEVELARGLVFRLRDQLAAWELLGLATPADVRRDVAGATTLFARAASHQQDTPAAAEKAREAISLGASTACRLAGVYADQALSLRMSNKQRLTTLLGVQMSGKKPSGAMGKRIAETFNLVCASCGWGAVEPSEGRRDWSEADSPVEWAKGVGLRVCGGPLLEFDDRRLPDWAYLWEGDVDTLASLMIGHARAAAERYKGRVHLWNVASRINRGDVLSLSDEQRLQIVAAAVRAVREVDPQTPVVVGFDQPWAEYRGRVDTELSPLDFADALERADLGIAGFNLELNVGYYPLATAMRNPLAFSRMIDLWNVRLEAPLMLSLTLPSDAGPDALADPKTGVVAGGDDTSLVTAAWQAEWVRDRVPMLLAKNAVQVLQWGQLTDTRPHSFPHGGLFGADNYEKPVVETLYQLRKRYLA